MNLQKTPLDRKAALVINATCDEVMTGLMARLQLSIPPFKLKRLVQIGHRRSSSAVELFISGVVPQP